MLPRQPALKEQNTIIRAREEKPERQLLKSADLPSIRPLSIKGMPQRVATTD